MEKLDDIELHPITQNVKAFGKSHGNSLEDAFMLKYPALWALKHKPIKQKPMTFRSTHNPFAHRPWQEDILNDSHKNKVIQKARQLGMSELATAEVLRFADVHPSVNIMYTFPTLSQMADFSRTRVSPVINASPRLKEQVSRDINNVSTKAIGNSNIFMRTSGDGAQGEGADVDMYCADEYDRMRQGAEYAFSESLSSSKYGLMRRRSTPTIPGMGINAQYEKSDQRRYLYKCTHCGEWQEITLDNIVQVKDGYNPVTQEIEPGTYEYRCIKCKKELESARRGVGEWVALRPDVRDVRGYFISQLNAVHIPADSIKKREIDYPFKQLYYNYVLGMPFANEGLVITEKDIKDHIVMGAEQLNRSDDFITYVVGIDWGEPTWVLVLGITVDGTIQIVSMRQFNRSETQPLYDVKQVIAHITPYKPELIIADAGYGADKNAELLRAFPTATYSCSWNTITSAMSSANFIDQRNDNRRMVTVDKTSKMQRVIQSVKLGYIGFYSWQDPMTKLITLHLKNVQILDKEKDGFVYQVATRKGADHLACCLSYALIGVDKITQYGLKVSRGYHVDSIDLNEYYGDYYD